MLLLLFLFIEMLRDCEIHIVAELVNDRLESRAWGPLLLFFLDSQGLKRARLALRVFPSVDDLRRRNDDFGFSLVRLHRDHFFLLKLNFVRLQLPSFNGRGSWIAVRVEEVLELSLISDLDSHLGLGVEPEQSRTGLLSGVGNPNNLHRIIML
jgi:hypothetical protein